MSNFLKVVRHCEVLFECYASLELYESQCCNYTTYEKVKKFVHICGSDNIETENNQKVCVRCNVSSFSFGWSYFHNHKCFHKTKKRKLKNPKNVNHNLIKFAEHFQCNQCDFKTICAKIFETHTNIHHQVTDSLEYFKCDQCEFKARYKNDFEEHKSVKHVINELPKQFKCDECEFITTREKYLKDHKLNKHAVWFKCEKCVFKSREISHLKIHKC